MRKPTLVIATRNRHKMAEIRTILGVACFALDDFPKAPALVEDAATFAGNAAGKALQLARWLAANGGDRATSSPGPLSLTRSVSPKGAEQREHAGEKGGLSGAGGPVLPEQAGLQGSCFVLADDSGLEVDALNGAPGVHSARFAALDAGAGENSSDTANNAKLLRLLQDVPPARRTARFRCVLALAGLTPVPSIFNPRVFEGGDKSDRLKPALQTGSVSEPLLFEGVCEGRISFAPSGQGGFGYDPLFIPDGFSVSFAELGEAVKNRISHRARALARLRDTWTPLAALD